jgi:hypothetical protein
MVNLIITAKKGFYAFLASGIAGLAVFAQGLPVEQAVWIPIIVSVLRILEDIIRHWSD